MIGLLIFVFAVGLLFGMIIGAYTIILSKGFK